MVCTVILAFKMLIYTFATAFSNNADTDTIQFRQLHSIRQLQTQYSTIYKLKTRAGQTETPEGTYFCRAGRNP